MDDEMKKYPYYIVPIVERYKELDPEGEEAGKLSRLIAANIGDYASLRLVLGIDPPEFARFYPDMELASPGTFDTIDSFLDKFGHDTPPLGYMATQEFDTPKEKTEDSKPTPNPEKTTPNITQETPENEFRRLLKLHKYKEAMQLIERQNLNNPNKSIYFAHQMRFLKKLIALDKYRNQRK